MIGGNEYPILEGMGFFSALEHLKYTQLMPVLSFMERSFTKDLSLEEMAALIDITPQHLCRLFKQAIGMRPSVYLTTVRLKKAKELIFQKDA